MSQKLTDTIVKTLPCPAAGNRIEYDTEVKGFGCRVTAQDSRSFILNYRTKAGRERRYTIGQWPDWKVAAARQEARELKQRVGRGEDPMGEVSALRAAPDVAALIKRFKEEHLPRTRSSTARDYTSILDKLVMPAIGSTKVADVTFSDIDRLHRRISETAPYRANRAVAVLSKMFSLAVKWSYRADNPVRGVQRNQEIKRDRYLSGAEIGRLAEVLSASKDQEAADIIRLLLLTGARRGEVLGMAWKQIDLEKGIWTKPGATTKQKTVHRVPLSISTRQLLASLREKAKDGAVWVFPSHSKSGHREEIKDEWADVCKAAEISEARIHDLRHTYASVLASDGQSLPVIGALLGHTQPSTTARYSHLFDDPLRAATEQVALIVSPLRKTSEI